jgi:GPH family glycoside/pentoside/hexuronide:cation symporter
MYFGANAFITRFAIALEALSMGAIFVLTGYNPYIYSQTQAFLVGLRVLVAGLPIIALSLAFAIIWFYPLSGRKLSEMEAKVARLHKRKGIK